MRKRFPGRLRGYSALLGNRITWQLAAGVFCGVSLFVLELAFAFLLQAFLRTIGAISPGELIFAGFLTLESTSSLIAAFLIVGCLKASFGAIQFYLQGATMEEFRCRQRSAVLHWALHSKSTNSGEVNLILNERITSASNAVQAMLQSSIFATVCVLYIVLLFSISPRTTLPVFLLLAIFTFPARKLQGKIKALGKRMLSSWTHTNSYLQMNLKNLILLQIYGTQEAEFATAESSLRQYRDGMLRFYRYGGIVTFITQSAGIALVCVLAILLFTYETPMQAGLKVSYLYLFYRFVQSSNHLANQLSIIMLHRHHLDELVGWSQRAAREKRVADASAARPPIEVEFPDPVGWRLSQVSFSYPGSSTRVVDNLDLTIPPGKITVITGPSGIGKTTVLGLLLGIVVPNSGEIHVVLGDGALSLQDCRSRLMRSIGFVGSESYMVEGTIRQNLVYGLDRVPPENEVMSALKRAQCDFVQYLPAGLDHVLTEQGQGLSSGQKQRLSLARALLRNPKALVLDEATSSLDFETEQKLIEIFRSLRGEVTIIAATHRTALVEIADKRVLLS